MKENSSRLSIGQYWHFLYRYLSPQKHQVVFMAIFLLSGIALQLIGPQILRVFINSAINGAGGQTLEYYALVFILTTSTAQIFKVLAVYLSNKVALTASNNLQIEAVGHLLSLDMHYHNHRSAGELIERTEGDIRELAGFLSSFSIQLMGNLLFLTGIIIALFVISPILGLVFAAFSLVALFALRLIRRRAIPFISNSREKSSKFYGFVGESISAAEDIRVNGGVPFVMTRIVDRLKEWLPVYRSSQMWETMVWITSIVIIGAADAIAYAVSGRLYLLNAISLGTAYLVVAYAAAIAEPLETIRTQFQELQHADASLLRLKQIFQNKNNITGGTAQIPNGPLDFEFKRVSFDYEGRSIKPALKNLSFHVQPGRILGIVGRTGSGKSTAARLIARLYDPTHGSIFIGGIDSRRYDLFSLRSKISFVTQEVQLFDGSLKENVTMFDSTVSDGRLLKVFKSLGLGNWIQNLPDGVHTPIHISELSAGEAQLIAFARAFIADPGLIILDEATSRMDIATESLVSEATENLLKGRTGVIIAHRLSTLDKVDDILVLDDGRIIESGPRKQLVENQESKFSRMIRISEAFLDEEH